MYLHSSSKKRLFNSSVCASLLASSMLLYPPMGLAQSQSGNAQGDTASPIKHVIIIVGENRSFDHVYATYVPKNAGEEVNNLLFEGIVNADGTPGPNFAPAHQFQVTTAPNGGKYFINASGADKALYTTLPPPEPQTGTLNLFTHRAVYFNCSDPSQPGVQAILNYLISLRYSVSSKCDAGRFYPAVNHGQGFNPDGTATDPTKNIPPTNMRSIGDELNDKDVLLASD